MDSVSAGLALKVDPSLIDPHFERYILDSRPRTFKCAQLKGKVAPSPAVVAVDDKNEASLVSTCRKAVANRLVVDRFSPSAGADVTHCYTILGDGSIVGVPFSNKGASCLKVGQINIPSPPPADGTSFPPNLMFIDKEHAVASNGCGLMKVFRTGNRSSSSAKEWEVDFEFSYEGEYHPFIIADVKDSSSCSPASGGGFLINMNKEVLLQSVISLPSKLFIDPAAVKGGEKPPASFTVIHLTWLTLTPSIPTSSSSSDSDDDDQGPRFFFEVASRKEVAVKGEHFQYATFSQPNKKKGEPLQVIIVTGKGSLFTLLTGRGPPVLLLPNKEEEEKGSPPNKEEEEKGSPPNKEEEEKGSPPNKEEVSECDPTQEVTTAVEGMSMATTTQAEEPLSFNTDQLEECDSVGVDAPELFMYWVNAEEDEEDITQAVDLSSGPVCFATRHDVDCIIWTIEGQSAPPKHAFTLPAFGYIQAGHSEKRFCGCSPEGEYAVLVNERNHAFVYYHKAPMEGGSELKNRRTGHVSTTFSKQCVINLPTTTDEDGGGELLGFYASKELLFLLTESHIYAYDLKL